MSCSSARTASDAPVPSRAARILSRYHCVLQICEDTPNAVDVGSPLAQARWSLLSQAKVLISLHRGDQMCFDWRGAVDAIHVGLVVVTEPFAAASRR